MTLEERVDKKCVRDKRNVREMVLNHVSLSEVGLGHPAIGGGHKSRNCSCH